jgi:pseudouridine-5'-phosphate glycosidase
VGPFPISTDFVGCRLSVIDVFATGGVGGSGIAALATN